MSLKAFALTLYAPMLAKVDRQAVHVIILSRYLHLRTKVLHIWIRLKFRDWQCLLYLLSM